MHGLVDNKKRKSQNKHNIETSLYLEHLDFMSLSDLPESCETHFSQIHHEYIGYQSLTDVPKAQTYREEKITCAVSDIKSNRTSLT